jgi:hypothetical protein
MSKSVNRASEVWDLIKPFAVGWFNSVMSQAKGEDTGSDPYAIILYDESGQKKRTYSFGADGLAAALAAAASGDVVWLPAGTITAPSGDTYTPGDEISTGAIPVTSEAGIEISGLAVGQWYAVEGFNGYWDPGPGWPMESSKFQLSDGTGYSGMAGRDVSGSLHTTPPDFGAFAEIFTGSDGKIYGRVYFQSPVTSIYARVGDVEGQFSDNSGTLSWRLRSAAYSGVITIPAGVELVGLGKNSIIDGSVVNEGILTNIRVTDAISGGGICRLVANPDAEVFSEQIQSAVADGTAPLVVASTALNVNFNADMVDGKHADELGGQSSEGRLPPQFLKIATNARYWYGIHAGQQDAIVTGGGKTFVFYFGDDYDNWCAVYDHASGWSAPVEVADGHTANDVHNYLSATMDADGYLHIFYGCHLSSLYYKRSLAPYDISAWTGEVSLDSVATYPKALTDSGNTLYVFYRSGTGTNKTNQLRMKKSTDGGETWSAATVIVQSEESNGSVYAGMIGLGVDDSLHVVWSLASPYGIMDAETIRHVAYAKSVDGGATWAKSNGSTYSLPISVASAEYIATGTRIHSQQVALDADHQPHVVYVQSDAEVYFTENQIHYCYLSGGAWQNVTLPGNDYDLSTHIVRDGAALYIVTAQLMGARREVVLFQSLDNGATWAKCQLTYGSSIDNVNAALHVGANGLELAWATGNAYTIEGSADIYYMNGAFIEQLRLAEVSAMALDDLSDVAITAPQAGDSLAYNGSGWVNQAPTNAGKYRHFLYVLDGTGDFQFLTDDDGHPLMGLLDLE